MYARKILRCRFCLNFDVMLLIDNTLQTFQKKYEELWLEQWYDVSRLEIASGQTANTPWLASLML
jgi:hypothetical protein